MKRRLLDFLLCPMCDSAIACSKVMDESNGEIVEGELTCSEGHRFPVIRGIPRLLEPDLLDETLSRFHPQHSPSKSEPNGRNDADNAILKKTLKSFGYQWNVFSEMYAHWEENFRSYFEPLLTPAQFKDKLILDAGCGFGRHAYYAAKFGGEVVAMDLSEAVEAAYVNTAEFPTVHVIQANIYRPPLRPMFDLVYCVGVIQHLPNPRTGFISLTGLLKKGAVLFVWVYGQRRGIYRVVDLMRKGTVHLPLRILYPLTFALNIVSHVLFSWPHTLLSHFPGLNRVAALWPFKRYAELPFRVGHADWFDRLSAPSTVYFSKDEVAGWFDETGLQNVKIQSRENIGWRGLGQVPRNAVE